LARGLLGGARRRGLAERLGVGLHIEVTGISGFFMLRLLSALRPWRRATARYADEQSLIDRWLRAIHHAALQDVPLALEIALCGRLIKGYSDTHQRGKTNFLRIMDTLLEAPVFEHAGRAAAIRQAREAALADPDGRVLDTALAAHGIPPQGPRPQPVKFFRRPTEAQRKVV
jgi:indolepyruvate ferredoxin oxidoreductase, beta subunit